MLNSQYYICIYLYFDNTKNYYCNIKRLLHRIFNQLKTFHFSDVEVMKCSVLFRRCCLCKLLIGECVLQF